jgi:hypothetical protein
VKSTKRLFDKFSNEKRASLKEMAKYCLVFREAQKINKINEDLFFGTVKTLPDGFIPSEQYWLPNGVKTESRTLALKMWSDILE